MEKTPSSWYNQIMSYRVGLFLKYLDEEYQASIFRGAAKAAEKEGIELICIQGDGSDNPIIPVSSHTALNLDGIIFLSSVLLNNSSDKVAQKLKDAFKPVPVVSIGVQLKDIPSIICQSETSVKKELDHLMEHHKYKKFLYLGGPKDNHDNQIRENVIRKVLEEKIKKSDKYSLTIKNGILFSESDGLKLAQDYCNKNPEKNIDVILAGSDDMAVGILKYINSVAPESYRKCPIVGFDDIPLAKTDQIALTTIKQPTEKLGEQAVQMMWNILRKKQVAQVKKIPSTLIIRNSCGCRGYHDDKSTHKDEHPLQREQFLRDVSYYGQEISSASDFSEIENPLAEFLTNIACRDFALAIYDKPVKNIPAKARLKLHITDFIIEKKNDATKLLTLKEIFKKILSSKKDPASPRCLYHLRVGEKRLGFILYTVDKNSPIYVSMAGMFLSHAIDRIFKFKSEKNRARELEREVEKRTAELKKESLRRQKVEEEVLKISDLERLRFSLDLHDDICQRLAAMAMICKKDSEKNPELKILFDMATETLARTRQYAHDSFPVELDFADICDALQSLCRESEHFNDLKISFTQSGTPSDLTSEQKINLFRIAQEALQNSIKHAKAKNITLSISFTERNINLTVTDDGIGLNEKNISKNDFKEKRRPRGLGRRSMEYRANQLNGTFKIESGKNSGTKVIVTIPKITSAEKEMS